MKSIVTLASLLIAAALTGCGTLDVATNGDGGFAGNQQPDIMQQLAADSQGASD